MGRRPDAPLGLRMVLPEPQLRLRAQLRLPGSPSSDRRSSRWHGIRRRVRDGSQRRIRQRLERPNCPEFDNYLTAWPVSRPLTIRQPQQLEVKRKTYSFVLSLSERLPHPRAMLSAHLTGHNRSRERCAPKSCKCCVNWVQQLSRRGCPLWVISGHSDTSKACPLYPRKRTCAVQLGMSALCQ